MNNRRVYLMAIIFVTFALRLLWLGEQSLWYDEGVSWLLAQKSLPHLIQWTAADIQPPLYYLILWLTTRLWGDSEWALRFPSVLFNLLTLPLLYALARHLFKTPPIRQGKTASLLAAVLFCFSPLMVYYSQETRMYTLLVLEAVLAGYFLIKILENSLLTPAANMSTFILSPPVWGYILSAATALYTHYFAAFLLVAHALYALIALRQQSRIKVLLARLGVLFGFTVTLFTPWATILLARLGDDPSYWPGALKLNEAIRRVVINFTGGETVFEQTGLGLALGYGAIFILGILAWLIQKTKTKSFKINHSQFTIHNSTLFLLLWLFIPIILILALSYRSPKFNPRYTLLAYPAFVLLLGLTLAYLTRPQKSRLLRYVSRSVFLASFLFVLASSLFSLYNWFAVIDFSKDDFKAMAQFVQERQKSNETVLLSSGHLFPVWAYYYGWDNWTPLPQMERLDVSRVTNLTIARDIAPAIAGKTGVWLITWQDEVVDPNGIVPFWLDTIGHRPGDAGDFWGVGLEHWRLEPDAVNSLRENPIRHPAQVNFANQLNLLGMTQLACSEIALFWQPRQPLPAGLLVTLNLTDNAGFKWNQTTPIGRPGAYLYPPSRWPVGQIVMTRHPLPWLTGSPPGDYLVEVGVGQMGPTTGQFTGWDILDEQGRPQRPTALLETITLSQTIQPEADFEAAETPLVDLSPVVAIVEKTISPATVKPGDRININLLWQAGESNDSDVAISFDLLDSTGSNYNLASRAASTKKLFLTALPPGNLIRSQHRLTLPPETAPGPATVRLRLTNTNSGSEQVFPIGRLDIHPTERNFTPPDVVNLPLNATFAASGDEPGAAILLGINCSTWNGTQCAARPGETVTLTLYWQAETPFDKAYTVFTHLLGPDETVLLNADHAPPKPSPAWVANEIITDSFTITLPPDLPPGSYPIEIGLYDAADPTFQRLTLPGGDNRVILPQLILVE